MSPRKRERKPPRFVRSDPSVLDRARDELFRAIRQCGVLAASAPEQADWMDDTLHFMAERHPELDAGDLAQLRDTGLRFCQPVIPHGAEHSALSHDDGSADDAAGSIADGDLRADTESAANAA